MDYAQLIITGLSAAVGAWGAVQGKFALINWRLKKAETEIERLSQVTEGLKHAAFVRRS